MRTQQTKQEQYFLRRWFIVVAIICLISSLGCSLAHSLVRPESLAVRPQKAVNVNKLEPRIRRRLPTLTPTVFHAPTLLPTITSSAFPNPTATATSTRLLSPTPSPIPPATATFAPLPTDTPLSVKPFTPAPPTTTPSPTFMFESGFAFLVAEVYTDFTANNFLTGYVAIVSGQEAPIGGIKAVGNFEPGDYYHESLLSNWFLEGYSVPGDVIKSGSVKFEPPGGIQKGTWHIHLEDEQGTRLSEDVSIATDPENKEWFFIKFRKLDADSAPTATPIFVAGVTPTPIQTTIGITQTAPGRPTPTVHPYCRYHPFAVRCRKR